MKIREHFSGTAAAGGPGDLLAAVPHLIGFHPQSSIVVVCVDLEEQRTGMLMRLDLPVPEHHEAYAAMLAQRLERHPPDAVVLACYGDGGGGGAPPGGPGGGTLTGGAAEHRAGSRESGLSGSAAGAATSGPSSGGAGRGELPHQALIECILDELADGPIEVLGAAYVDGGRWWTYDCDHPGCCPADGVALPGPGVGAAAQVAVRAAVRGRRTLASRGELEDGVRGPSGADETALLGVFARVDRELAAEALSDGASAVRRRTVELARLLLAQTAEGRCEVSDADVARLSLGAADILVRDRFAAFEVPDAAVWLSLLTELARRTPDARAAPICTVLAWVAYQHGDGAMANVALDRVQAVDPAHTMAGLLRDCLDGQVSPEHITAATRQAVGAAGRARKEVMGVGA